jgi:hypothetical protein
MGSQRHGPAALPPGMIRYPLYRRLGGPQGRSGRVGKTSPPPGFDPRSVQSVASRYNDWDIPAHILLLLLLLLLIIIIIIIIIKLLGAAECLMCSSSRFGSLLRRKQATRLKNWSELKMHVEFILSPSSVLPRESYARIPIALRAMKLEQRLGNRPAWREPLYPSFVTITDES